MCYFWNNTTGTQTISISKKSIATQTAEIIDNLMETGKMLAETLFTYKQTNSLMSIIRYCYDINWFVTIKTAFTMRVHTLRRSTCRPDLNDNNFITITINFYFRILQRACISYWVFVNCVSKFKQTRIGSVV